MNSFMQISPLSTLESSFEALNAKKFDGDLTYFFFITGLVVLNARSNLK